MNSIKRDTGLTDARYEQKFLIPPDRVEGVRELLRHACVEDARYEEDTVSTVYFDTEGLSSFAEVVNGDICKEKLRLRWYEKAACNDQQGPVMAFLEAKRKQGFRGSKTRREIRLGNGFLASPLDEDNYCTPEFREALARADAGRGAGHIPVVLIKYRRDRFIEPWSGARISLDSDIRVVALNARLVNGRPVKTDKTVLEIKDRLYKWPDALRPLDAFKPRNVSFSKYAFCLDACRFNPELAGKWI